MRHINFHTHDVFILRFHFLTPFPIQLSKRQAIWLITGLFELMQFKYKHFSKHNLSRS